LDDCSRAALRRLASDWRESPSRPLIAGSDALLWHETIHEWVRDRSMPLLVRLPHLGRGREIRHASGRILVPADDSPAKYMLSAAMLKRPPDRDLLYAALCAGRLPVAASMTEEERDRARYTGTEREMDAPNLRELGYAVCHITRVGLRRAPLEERTEVELIAHSLLFLSPVNMFVVPREYAGLGRLPEFIDEMDDARSFMAHTAN